MQVTRVFAPRLSPFCIFNIPQCTADSGAVVSVSWSGISNNICSFAHDGIYDEGTLEEPPGESCWFCWSVQRTSL